MYSLGLAYLQAGRIEEAIFFLERSTRLSGSFAPGYYALACAYESIGQPWPALVAIRKNVELDRAWPGLLKLGQIYLGVGYVTNAIESGLGAVGAGGESSEVHVLLAEAYADTDPDASVAHLERATVIDASAADTFTNRRAKRLARIGRLDEAAALYETTLTRDSRPGTAYLNFVTVRTTQEEDRETVARMDGLADGRVLPKEERMQLHFALGKAYRDLGELGSAMPHYDAANSLGLLVHPYLRKFDPSDFARRIDRIIEIYSEEFIRSNQVNVGDSRRPIFIVGMMRSGTTVVEQILSRHPHVAAAGELAFWPYAEKRILRPDPFRVHRSTLLESISAYLEILDAVDPLRPRVTDKNPGNMLTLGLIAAAFPEASIVWISRDSIDTALSIYMTPSRHPPEFGGIRENIVCALRECERLMRHWVKVLGSDRIHSVRYEDLVANPGPVIRDMLDACGLEWDEACLHPELSRTMVGTPSMWQVRQPLNTGSVGRADRYGPWLGAFADLR